MFKLYCLIFILTIKFLIKDISLQEQLLNKLAQARQFIDSKEYFNAKLAVDNLRHIYNIYNIVYVVLVRELEILEKLTKRF
jgi:hypothetical protein